MDQQRNNRHPTPSTKTGFYLEQYWNQCFSEERLKFNGLTTTLHFRILPLLLNGSSAEEITINK